ARPHPPASCRAPRMPARSTLGLSLFMRSTGRTQPGSRAAAACGSTSVPARGHGVLPCASAPGRSSPSCASWPRTDRAVASRRRAVSGRYLARPTRSAAMVFSESCSSNLLLLFHRFVVLLFHHLVLLHHLVVLRLVHHLVLLHHLVVFLFHLHHLVLA